jgi:hypothetical protein
MAIFSMTNCAGPTKHTAIKAVEKNNPIIFPDNMRAGQKIPYIIPLTANTVIFKYLGENIGKGSFELSSTNSGKLKTFKTNDTGSWVIIVRWTTGQELSKKFEVY